MSGDEFLRLCRLFLQATPSDEDDEAWFLDAKRNVLDQLGSLDPPPSDDFFHFLHHYVSDVDVRRRDPSYRDAQNAAFAEQMSEYEANLY